MAGTGRVLAGALLICGCGGGGDGPPGGAAPRQWDRVEVQQGGNGPSLSISSGGVVDFVYRGSVGGQSGVVWQQLDGSPELVEMSDDFQMRPRVGRGPDGTVHVVWGASNPDEIRYATRVGGSWSVEAVASDRFRPDLVVADDGTPHLAFVDEETGNGMAYHATRSGDTWQIEPVNATNWFGDSEVGIALDTDGHPVVAAPTSDGNGVWLAESDGVGNWTVTDLAPERTNSGVVDVAVGTAGIAVGFKDGSFTVIAWRPTGSSEWAIEDASHHDSSSPPISVAVTALGPIVVSDVDVQYPNGVAVLERTTAGWEGQLLGSRGCGEDGHHMAIDGDGRPAIALTCNYDGVYYMTVVGNYPADWNDQCQAAANEMCGPACTCGVDGEDCCWGLGGNSTCTSSFGCPINGVAAMCGDPTVSPEALQLCRDELPTLTCSIDGPLDLTGACGALFQPFQ